MPMTRSSISPLNLDPHCSTFWTGLPTLKAGCQTFFSLMMIKRNKKNVLAPHVQKTWA